MFWEPLVEAIWYFDLTGTAKPLYWQRPVYELDPRDPENNGFINEDLIIWMREAAFPTFKKLYGILNHRDAGGNFSQGLPAGNYSVDISYSILLTPISFSGLSFFREIFGVG